MSDMNAHNPPVSVVIPAYNAEDMIGLCLEGLAAQSHPQSEFETIVVDDGSTDGTAEVVGRYDVRLIRQENRGPAAARNRGASEARGEILLFTDADCVPDAGWVEAQTRVFDDTSVTACKGVYRTEQRSLTARFAQVEFEERYELLGRAGKTDMVDTYCAGFRTEVFREFGGFDESFPVANNEDTDLAYRLSAQGHRLIFNPAAVVRHLAHPDCPLGYWGLKFKRGYWRMAVYRRFPGKMLSETYTPSGLKLQVIATGLAAMAAVASPFFPKVGVPVLIAAVAAVALAGLRLFRTAFRHDRAVCLLLPFFIVLRASALALGSAAGLVFPGGRERRQAPARQHADAGSS